MSIWVSIPGSKSGMVACTCNPIQEETELVGTQGLLTNQSDQIRELQAHIETLSQKLKMKCWLYRLMA